MTASYTRVPPNSTGNAYVDDVYTATIDGTPTTVHQQRVGLYDSSGNPLTLSDATAANQSALNTLIGAVTETAPATDIASAGLNGRLQRIAQNITSNFVSLLARLPLTLGQKAKTASFPVVIASDQDALAVTGAFYQATQPVSGTVTANAGSGTMAVSGPLTDTQLRATGLPVTQADGASVTIGLKADAAWDGAAASPTVHAVLKYIGSKIEAVRALLAGTLTVAQSNSNVPQTAVAITSGASLSGPLLIPIGHTIDRLDTVLAGGSAWTAAAMTFTVCETSGGTYRDVYLNDGTEYSIPSGAFSAIVARSVVVPPGDLAGLGGLYLKLRSGTGAAAVNQGADRTVVVTTKPV